jgi:hypothetical protein
LAQAEEEAAETLPEQAMPAAMEEHQVEEEVAAAADLLLVEQAELVLEVR